MESDQQIINHARQHVENNTVLANPARRRCVDGGYTADEADGSMAIPGADQGTVMGLVAMGYNPQKAFDIVYDYVTSKGWKFGYHSDTHAEHDESLTTGCGHCQAGINGDEEGRYDISGEQASEIQQIIDTKAKESPDTMDRVILDREHSEKAILVVLKTEHTVNPWDADTGDQYFIYDKARHMAYLSEIAPRADVDENALIKIVEKQTDATLGLLGSSKGKPVITADFDENGENPILEQVGNAPDYSAK